MEQSIKKNISIKTRLSLAVSILFAVVVMTASYAVLAYFEHHLKEDSYTQQFSHITSLAGSIDDKLRIAQKTLIAAAAAVPRDVWTNTDKAQQFIDERVGTKSIFDTVIFFMSKDGKLIAESPFKPDRRGKDLSFREYYKVPFATMKPYISRPFISTHLPGHTAINIIVPVFNDRGKLAGFIGGGIDLLGKNFLADLSKIVIGKSGYIFIADNNRNLIIHPDKSRIMKEAAPLGANRLFDRAINGFEGSGETITSNGVKVISSFKHLGMTPWIIGSSYPTSEIFAYLHQIERYLYIGAVLATAILSLISWFTMRRILSPLSIFTRHISELSNKTSEERHVVITVNDEIGVMAQEFNSMLDTLDSQQEDLEKQRTKEVTARIFLEKVVEDKNKIQEALNSQKKMLVELNQVLEERVVQTVADLRQKDQMLIQQSRQAAMGEMINNIAHQWRQPLNNLGLIVQSLQIEFGMGQLSLEEMNTQSAEAMATILFMSRTIDDFRNYFRQDKEKSLFNVNQAINRTISIIESSLNNQHITIEISSSDDPVIYGYPNEYSQVILNILINARDALMEQGTSKPQVIINICKENEKSVVTVTDNAGGIPENIIYKIFDPYFTTKGPDKGTGIGLFMSKTIIETSMNGKLTVKNTGSGAEFRIEA